MFETILPKNLISVIIQTQEGGKNMAILPLTEYINKAIKFDLYDQCLNEQQFIDLIDYTKDNYFITYSGNLSNLDYLLKQLGCAKEKNIKLNLINIETNYSICLDFSSLGPNTMIYFTDKPNLSSSFNTYLINGYEEMINEALIHLETETKTRIIEERNIQESFIKDLKQTMAMHDKSVYEYNKDELMDLIFNYVRNHYPNEYIISKEFIPESYNNTAYMTYKNNKGTPEGRSKLIKLYTNNKYLNIPCYLVTGKYGKVEHIWNEFISPNGDIIEYDSSYNKVFSINDLPRAYEIEYHEPEVIKKLYKTKNI